MRSFEKVLIFSLILAFIYLFLYYPQFNNKNLKNQQVQENSRPINIQIKSNNINNEKNDNTWDTLDGEGFQFSENTPEIPLDPRYHELEKLPPCTHAKPQENATKLMEKARSQFFDCITPIMKEFHLRPRELSLNWMKRVTVCDQIPVLKELDVVAFPNLHETKWAVLPKCKEENYMVTLGVGHDTMAEEKLNRTLPNTKFFGADPIIEPNRQMYSAFGNFYPFAIGRSAGISTFRVLPNQNQRKSRIYSDQQVTTIPFLYFIQEILKLKRVDFLWIDVEGGEAEFLEKIHSDAQICQFNLEVHANPKYGFLLGAQAYHDFIFKILDHKKFIFMYSAHTGQAVFKLFFLNIHDEECIAKYYNKY